MVSYLYHGLEWSGFANAQWSRRDSVFVSRKRARAPHSTRTVTRVADGTRHDPGPGGGAGSKVLRKFLCAGHRRDKPPPAPRAPPRFGSGPAFSPLPAHPPRRAARCHPILHEPTYSHCCAATANRRCLFIVHGSAASAVPMVPRLPHRLHVFSRARPAPRASCSLPPDARFQFALRLAETAERTSAHEESDA